MNKYIITLCFLLSVCLYSCKDDIGLDNENVNREPGKGLPISFVTEISSMENQGDASRVDDPYKTQFNEGDLLHVSAVFTLIGEGNQPITQYDCFSYTQGEWVSLSELEPMNWPWNAERATFTAYYIGGSDGLLVESQPLTVDLSTLTDDTDPLVAIKESVPYGNAVKLTFTHLCTKLTFTEVSSKGDEFWAKTSAGINNTFQLTRNTKGELKPEFVKSEETADTWVSAQRTETNTVSYYLSPGNYEGMQLTYRYSRPYLTLNINELNNLGANHSYVVSITQNSGSITIDEDEDDWWEDPESEDEVKLDELNIKDFLDAIAKGEAYSINQTLVLGESSTIEGGTELLVNVDFQNNTFIPIDLPNTAEFNGNYHYIKNIAHPLFNTIDGSIINLGAYNVKINEKEGTTGVGAMGRTLSSSGTINNIRLNGITIKATPPQNAGELCDVGALVGNSAGSIETVRLGGNITVTVTAADPKTDLGRIYIGGLVGQLSGSLNDVARLNEENPGSVTVTNNCPNEIGERYTGGLVGLLTGSIDNSTMEATVDASNARGVLVYTGGLAGMARGEVGIKGTDGIRNSTFNGTIRIGKAYSTEDNTVEGHAYAGGLIGHAYYVDQIDNNQVFGTLHGPTGDEDQPFNPYTNSIYATGGLFGQIYQSESSGNVTWINLREQPGTSTTNYHIGAIAGRADKASNVTTNTSHITDYDPVGDYITSDDIEGESGN